MFPLHLNQIRNYLLSQDLTHICEQVIKDFDAEREVEMYQELMDAPAPSPSLSPFQQQHTSRAFFASTNLHTSMSLTGSSHNAAGDFRPMSTIGSSTNNFFDRGMSIRSPTTTLPDATSQKAEDGKTPIAPEKGIMAGKGLTAKNKKNQTKQLMSSLLSMSKTKTRWYILDGKNLSWTRYDGANSNNVDNDDYNDNDSISMSKVLDIREQTTDPDLLKVATYHFDIVTETRVLSIAVDDEESYVKWLQALRYAKEKSRTQGAGVRRVRDMDMLDIKVVKDKLSMFEKQVAVFQAIMAADLEGSVKEALGGLNAGDGSAVFAFLQVCMLVVVFRRENPLSAL